MRGRRSRDGPLLDYSPRHTRRLCPPPCPHAARCQSFRQSGDAEIKSQKAEVLSRRCRRASSTGNTVAADQSRRVPVVGGLRQSRRGRWAGVLQGGGGRVLQTVRVGIWVCVSRCFCCCGWSFENLPILYHLHDQEYAY